MINRRSDESPSDSSEPTIDAPSFVDRGGDRSDFFLTEQLALPYQLAQYRLEEEVGQGGMGVVYKATHPQHQTVAVKLLKHGILGTLEEKKRFRKEAILHAQIESDHVVKQIEFCCNDRLDFIVSEYISGPNLESVISRVFELGMDTSLKLIRDVLAGVSDLHRQGILHRDVKPSNVLLTLRNASDSAFSSDQFVKASLTDFGLARHISQSQSLAMTQTHATLGTPMYMAPEQFGGQDVGPASDVYSVGCTLYHLLTGRPPFQSKNATQVALMHRQETPRNLKRINPNVSDVLNHVVLKSLLKEPRARYPDGSAMLADIEAILHHEPTRFAAFPAIPETNFKTYTFEKTFDCPPDRVWPYVAETDRFNRAMGLPAPEFTFEGKGLTRKLMARTNFNGLKVEWREHPFEWIVNQRMSVLREFESGPFRWVANTVILEELADNRTRLIHEFQVRPQGWFGKVFTPVQFGFMTPRDLGRVYAEIEKLATRTDGFACDAAIPSKNNSQTDAKLLYQAVDQLTASGHPSKSTSALARYLNQSSDSSVSRIQPLVLARQLKLDTQSFLTLCFDAHDCELLVVCWDIVCPVCQLATATVESLQKLESHQYCQVCELEFPTDFANSVELIFSIHPRIRAVDRRTYCVGGPFHSPHVLAQIQLSNNQVEQVQIPFEPGRYLARSPQLESKATLWARDTDGKDTLNLALPLPSNSDQTVATGLLPCSFSNASQRSLMVRLERSVDRQHAVTVEQLFENSEFRSRFESQWRSLDEVVHNIFGFILAIRSEAIEELISRVGESNASQIWNQFVDSWNEHFGRMSSVATTFDQVIAVGVSDWPRAIGIVAFVKKFMHDKSPFSLVLSQANYQVSGRPPTRRFFGKTIRNVTAMSQRLHDGQLLIHRSLVDDELRNSVVAEQEQAFDDAFMVFTIGS